MPPDERLRIGIQLADMMLLDDAPDHAIRVTQAILGLADALPDGNPAKFMFWKLQGKCLEQMCDYHGATAALERAIGLAPDKQAKETLEAQLVEMHLLQGEFGNVLKSLGK